MKSISSLVEEIEAGIEKRFERFALRRAIDTATRRRGSPLTIRWSFATDYGFAIEEAICEYADLLTQAVIARRKALTKKICWDIVDAVIGCADKWKSWDFSETFVAIAKGCRGRRVPLSAQKAFLEELEPFEAGWGIEALKAVRLRSVLSLRVQPPRVQVD